MFMAWPSQSRAKVASVPLHHLSLSTHQSSIDLTYSLPLWLRVDLPVQLGLRKKFKSCPKNAQNLCRHILGSFPKKLCENCAVQILHNLCTFLMPPHMFRTNFRGPLGTTPRTNFAQFSQTRGMFLESASVQANHVSTLWRGNMGGYTVIPHSLLRHRELSV